MNKWLIAVFSAFIVACGTPDEDRMSKSERLEIITELEKKAYANMDKFDTTTALALVKNYARFADENEGDELSPLYLFKAGDLAMALHKPQLSIKYFNLVIEKYADFDKVPYCMFLKGFVYEDQIGDLDAARKAYEAFINTYPEHDMSDAARFSIKNLGKSPEELIREFEERNDTIPAEI